MVKFDINDLNRLASTKALENKLLNMCIKYVIIYACIIFLKEFPIS